MKKKESLIDHCEIKKIVIIAKVIFPIHSPRSFRTTELAKELARKGHKFVLYAALGDYNYKDFEQQHKLRIKILGKRNF